MSDETQNQDMESQNNAPAEANNTEHMIPKSRFDEVNNKFKELKKQLDDMQRSKSESETKSLEEQKRYQELYEKLKAETDPIRQASEQLQRYRESFENSLKARIERIPEDKRRVIPAFDDPIQTMAWLDEAESLNLFGAPSKPQAPNLNGTSGAVGSAKDAATGLPATTQSVLDIAKQYGYSVNQERAAQYARNPIKPTKLGE